MLNKAIAIAAKAHECQIDKGGNPYILHPLRMMMNCEGEDAKICAVLHDVIEDTSITLEDLRSQGFNNEIIATLDCLTKREGESYNDFISRVLPNELACRVKLEDLADNLDLTRIKNPSADDKARIEKYKLAVDRISDALSYPDAIPKCRMIELNGVAEIHTALSCDQFCDMFISFVEVHGWSFDGDIKEITDEKQEDWHARE